MARKRPKHEPVLPDQPAVVRFQQYARFEHVDLATNQQRLYVISWQPLLRGGGMLMRTWGESVARERAAPSPTLTG